MSADNGVYILVTNRGRGKREYRVAEAQAIENLTDNRWWPVHDPLLDVDVMVNLFGESKVLRDRKIAEGYAMRMLDEIERNGGVCEYGIKWLEFPTIRFPRTLLPGMGSRVLP